MPMQRELIKKKHYRQNDEVACIPACLRMVLSLYGVDISEEHLIELLNTGITGSTLDNLEGLKQIHFEAIVEQSSLVELALYLQETNMPAIVVLYTGYLDYLAADSLHAVVVVGVDEENVYFNDPLRAEHPIILSIDRFHPAWEYWGQLLIKLRRITTD